MKNLKSIITVTFIAFSIIMAVSACSNESKEKFKKKINLRNLFKKAKQEKTITTADTSNIFDNENYDPSKIDSSELIKTIEAVYEADSSMVEKLNKDSVHILAEKKLFENDTSTTKEVKFTNNIKDITTEEILALKYNLEQLKTKRDTIVSNPENKREKALIWADISKKNQKLYLWVEGVLTDSFLVSTGDVKHETPLFDRRPQGPILKKYSSKKYPGGNWQGLGNMPYVVFIQNGYGVHGTTIGNIKKLGTKASHGCIRLHPDNAKIFNELVRAAGLENTWITVRE